MICVLLWEYTYYKLVKKRQHTLRTSDKREYYMKKILGFGIVVFLVFMAAILTTNYWNTNNTEKDVLKYETSLPMTYKKLLNEYQESWNLSKGEAMGELESIGLSDQDNRGKYKILWVQLPKTEENICGGYIQFLCQTSQEKQEEMINEVLGMAFGLKEDERLFYNGKIKIWWRDNDRLEFVCNGEFGAAKGMNLGDSRVF